MPLRARRSLGADAMRFAGVRRSTGFASPVGVFCSSVNLRRSLRRSDCESITTENRDRRRRPQLLVILSVNQIVEYRKRGFVTPATIFAGQTTLVPPIPPTPLLKRRGVIDPPS